MQTFQDWISQYLLDCQYQKGLDPKTIKAYRIDLAQFSMFIDQRNLELTREGILEYITDLYQQYKPKQSVAKLTVSKHSAAIWSASANNTGHTIDLGV